MMPDIDFRDQNNWPTHPSSKEDEVELGCFVATLLVIIVGTLVLVSVLRDLL